MSNSDKAKERRTKRSKLSRHQRRVIAASIKQGHRQVRIIEETIPPVLVEAVAEISHQDKLLNTIAEQPLVTEVVLPPPISKARRAFQDD